MRKILSLCILMAILVLLPFMCFGTESTSTSIYGYDLAKGYVIYAKSFTTSASAEVVGMR